MSVTEKTQIGTIDLTPTWRQQVTNCLTVIENVKPDHEAAKFARDELYRMGDLLDRLTKEIENIAKEHLR